MLCLLNPLLNFIPYLVFPKFFSNLVLSILRYITHHSPMLQYTPPPKHNITNIQFSDYFNTFNNNFIIGGDFNPKHQSWGCCVNNSRGVILYNFTNSNRLKILVPPDPKYWPSSSRKNPDILDIFVAKILNNLHYIKNLLNLNSDHSSVLLTLNISPTYKETNKIFNKFTDHSKFFQLVNTEINLNIKLKTSDDIDLAVYNLTNVIKSVAWSATNTISTIPSSDSWVHYS